MGLALRILALALLAAMLSACATPDEHAPASASYQAGVLRLDPPSFEAQDPAVRLLLNADVADVKQDDHVLYRSGEPSTSVLPLVSRTAPVFVHYSLQTDAQPSASFGSERVLIANAIRSELAAITIGVALTFGGLLMLLVSLLRLGERRYLWLGVFASSLGWVSVAQSPTFRILLDPNLHFWRWTHDASVFLYPIGFALFVHTHFRDEEDEWMPRLALACAAGLGIAVVLAAANAVPLAMSRRLVYLLIFPIAARAIVIARKAANHGDVTGLMFNWGFSVTLFIGLPDMIWGAGYRLLPFSTTHFAALVFVLVLLAVTEYRFDEQLKNLLIRNTEVQTLNIELRRQVADRSHALAEALGTRRIEAAKIETGLVFDGRYRIQRKVGSGGMGEVYEVLRLVDDKLLALKVMTGSSAPVDAARFAREAEIAAQMDDPHVVSVLDVGISHGALYLVMELVDAGSIEDKREKFGDVAWAKDLLAQVASGLAALHEHGIVHRDLKPANVLLSSADSSDKVTAKITDFGISRMTVVNPLAATARPSDPTRLTSAGSVMGTPVYMAPEGAAGTEKLDAHADIFAFGVMAHEMLSGGMPFEVAPIFEEWAGRQATFRSLRTTSVKLPDELMQLLDACLAHEPDERPNAKALAQALAS